MASTTFSAQGTAFAIAGTAGGTITVTAATKASPCVVTATNTLAVGDVVVFPSAGLTGMPEIGGRIGIVTVASGSSFTVGNIDSSGFASAATGGTCTPQTWTKVGNVKDYTGFDGSKSELDTSNMDSLAKEFIPGLEDFGQMAVTIDVDPTDAGQIAMRMNKAANVNTYFRIALPNGKYRAWKGFVKKFGESGGVDKLVGATADIRIVGRPAFSEVVN